MANASPFGSLISPRNVIGVGAAVAASEDAILRAVHAGEEAHEVPTARVAAEHEPRHVAAGKCKAEVLVVCDRRDAHGAVVHDLRHGRGAA